MTPFFKLNSVAFAFASAFSLPMTSFAQSEIQEVVKQKVPEESKLKATPEETKKKSQTAQKANETVQKISIIAGKQSDVDLRRNSIAGKIVVGREELDRDGDSTVGEILKRLPGVTTGGRPGRGGDVRMRGMGGGYTQILLNGERPPRGFSMESLSPDQVERIEIMRGPVAEFSTQAIAGTINIILREEYHAKDADLKLSLGMEQGRTAPNLSLTYPGQIGALTYAISGSIFRNGQHDESESHNVDTYDTGVLKKTKDQLDHTDRSSNGIHITPRFSYKFENGDSLNFQPFLMSSHSRSHNLSQIVEKIYVADPRDDNYQKPAIVKADSISNSDSTMARGNLTYQHKFEDNSKLNLKFGSSLGHAESHSERHQYGADGAQLNLITDVNNTRDTNLSGGGKYTTPIGDKQNMALGWEVETGKRNQKRVSLDNGLPQFIDSGDNLDASTKRVATYVQDEFDIDKEWSAYAGLRWEGINTHSKKSNYIVDNSSSVMSPILHAVYRIPGAGKDQLRMSLTSSYRAPSLNDIIAVPTISPLNSATRPDRSGNPELKPERARGVDLAFEHYLKNSGILS
ncbi:MAG: TonB-dependent receptor, partial [Undibacterium sp.]|nr:TonB-dependent receptor [Undibacterium sp.]